MKAGEQPDQTAGGMQPGRRTSPPSRRPGRALGRLEALEEQQLVERAQRGDVGARQRLVDYYGGLIAHIASQYRCPGFERDDLFQEGVLGLLRALRGFDPTRGCRFSTYATFWIRQGIQRSIDRTGRLIGLPVDLCHSVRNVEAARDRFIAESGYPPSVDELAEQAGISRRRLWGLLLCLDAPVSLDALCLDGEEETAC
ncbi:MAG: sigma-70 family RNA polymerase sigma factor [Dehalococcoidia bacterium]|nr:sigma-70 family RNA polymerase sigma factor [Dehalococcoidia bacterium]